MHDSQIEDHLRTVLRTEGGALTLTITADELERRLALRRRARAGRQMSLMAAGVGAVLIGSVVAVSNGWLSMPGVGSGPEGTALPSTSPTESGISLPCETIDPTAMVQPPALIMSATPGDAVNGYGGVIRSFQLGNRLIEDAGGWGDPDSWAIETIPAGPPTERLQVVASGPGACLVSLHAEAVPIHQIEPVIELATITTDPTRLVEFDQPPLGEWLVLVRAEFATDHPGGVWTETYFRVLVRDATASATSLPTVLPDLHTVAESILVDAWSESTAPTDPTGLTTETVVGQVPPRSFYRVSVVCLGFAPLRWSIGHEAQFGFLAAGDQTCDGTARTHAVELGTPSSDLDVVIQGDPATAWHIVVSSPGGEPSFIPPALSGWLGADVGDSGTTVFGRCPRHANAADQCSGQWLNLDGVRPWAMPGGGANTLTFALSDGWAIDEARFTAVAADLVRAGEFTPEHSVAFRDKGGLELTVPVALDPGSWILRVDLNATKDGDTFGAYYDLPLFIGE